MDRKLFRRFRIRLLGEALFRSSVFALCAASIGLCLLSFVFHCLTQKMSILLGAAVFGGIFILAFCICFFGKLYPTVRRTAARVDEAGLKERIGTMVAFSHADSALVRLQRKDAVEKLGRLQTKEMPHHYRRKDFVFALLCLLLAGGMLILPYDLFSFRTIADSDDETKRQEQVVNELLSRLREEVKENDYAEDLRRELEDMIDDLEEKLQESRNELDRTANIDEAEDRVSEVAHDQNSREDIGEALMEQETTKKLGEAIQSGDKEAIHEALEEMQEEVLKDREQADKLAEDLEKALKKSGVHKNDPLRKGLQELADELKDADKKSDGDVKEDFKQAEEKISDALREQEELAEKLKKLQEMLEKAKDDLLQREEEQTSGEGEESSGEGENSGEGDPTSGEGSSGEGEGSSGEGDPTSGEGEGDPTSGEGEGKQQGEDGDDGGHGAGTGDSGYRYDPMIEPFYDPISGRVSYGKVIDAYYMEYLKAVERGEISIEMQKVMEKYYAGLME